MEVTPELAEACGIHAGDGYLRKRQINKTELDISGHIEEKSYYDNHVVPLFNKIFNLNISGRYFSRGTYGFVIWNKNVGPLFNKLGFPYGKKSKIVRCPNIILQEDNKILFARFLRGLFDTDGCLSFSKRYGKYTLFKLNHHYYPTLSIATISKQLSEEISFMLKKLNINYFVHGYQPKNPRDNYRYTLIINGVGRLNQWMKLIGTKNPVKLSRYLIWKKHGFCPTNTNFQQREDILKGKLDIYSIGL